MTISRAYRRRPRLIQSAQRLPRRVPCVNCMPRRAGRRLGAWLAARRACLLVDAAPARAKRPRRASCRKCARPPRRELEEAAAVRPRRGRARRSPRPWPTCRCGARSASTAGSSGRLLRSQSRQGERRRRSPTRTGGSTRTTFLRRMKARDEKRDKGAVEPIDGAPADPETHPRSDVSSRSGRRHGGVADADAPAAVHRLRLFPASSSSSRASTRSSAARQFEGTRRRCASSTTRRGSSRTSRSSEATPQEQKKPRSRRGLEAAMERMMNKVSLVTIWVEPKSHQIVKYTFDNVNFDFLPAAWLVRIDDLKASMTMSQPFKDVWLPKDVDMFFSAMIAIGVVRRPLPPRLQGLSRGQDERPHQRRRLDAVDDGARRGDTGARRRAGAGLCPGPSIVRSHRRGPRPRQSHQRPMKKC